MTYVDGFLIPLPKKNIPDYRRQATLGSKVWIEHGALDYKECVADELVVDDGHGNKVSPFASLTKLAQDETLVFAFIVYKSKAHRNAVNKKVMKDPRILKSAQQPMPFDMARFNYGGFKAIVERSAGRKPAPARRGTKARRW